MDSSTAAQLNGSWPHYGRWCGSHNETLWNIEQVRRSVDFRARELDHLGPLLCICGDECAEVCGRACKHHVAEVGDPRLHPGIGEVRIDLLVELVDDFGGFEILHRSRLLLHGCVALLGAELLGSHARAARVPFRLVPDG